MVAKRKKTRIGFDLDGVIIGKPPLIPKKLIEYLYRGRINKRLSYRFPGKVEMLIRWLSHSPFVRTPINENVNILRKISKNKDIELYAISGRYQFLKERTDQWLKAYKLEGCFKKVYLNEDNKQPHLFKKNLVEKLKLDYFVEDDPLVVGYLKKKTKNAQIVDVADIKNKLDAYWKPEILVSISYYLPNISGLTIYAQNLAEELVNRGYKVRVLTSRHLDNLKSKEKINGVSIRRVWTPLIFGRGPIMPTFLWESFKYVKDPDVVNCHIPQFEAVIICLWAKLLKKRIVLTHHCDLSSWPGIVNQITEKITYLSLLLSGLMADRIVVYTKDYAKNSDYLSRFENKLVYILPPVKLEKPRKFGFDEHFKGVKYRIGFAGRIAREKGIQYLLEAIPLLKDKLGNDFKIFLAGPSRKVIGGGFQNELKNSVERNRQHVVFLGSLDRGQMSQYYKRLDVLVLPSIERLESFGFVQVEAMLSGCPVVASNLPGVRVPTSLSGMGKIFKKADAVNLANAVLEIINNKDKFVNKQRRASKIFDHKRTIRGYETLFRVFVGKYFKGKH
ncbi:MAG: glycosyltransferase family 4 protein [Candidatus Woesebacteria bacterium]|jgi:glycosyltransferase involved in cell wall biosynthesis